MAVSVRNDYSFPAACLIRFRFPPRGDRRALDLFWYDGSIRPPTPDELELDNQELAAEGMMFVGDKGKILAGFRGEAPRLIPEQRMREYQAARTLPGTTSSDRDRDQAAAAWVGACKGGPPTFGDFLLAGPISDAFNLGAVSLRLGGRKLTFDAAAGRITNLPDANRLLVRDYRKGWELTGEGA